jgi:hypothetical protein
MPERTEISTRADFLSIGGSHREKDLWSFADKEALKRLVSAYVAQRDGHAAPASAPGRRAEPGGWV